jgi:hypothetical protein
MDYKMKISLQHWRSSGGRRGFSVELGSHLAGWGLLTSRLDLNMRRGVFGLLYDPSGLSWVTSRSNFKSWVSYRIRARGPSELLSYLMGCGLASVILLTCCPMVQQSIGKVWPLTTKLQPGRGEGGCSELGSFLRDVNSYQPEPSQADSRFSPVIPRL